MYAKNKGLKDFVKAFDLDIKKVEVSSAPLENCATKTSEQLIQENTMAKKETTTGDKFANAKEVDFTPNDSMEFVKFENEGDSFIGKIYGAVKEIKNSDKTNTCYIAENEDGEMVLLPSNVNLNNKLKKLCEINKESLTIGVDVKIINEGLQKIEGVTNKVKVFKVLVP